MYMYTYTYTYTCVFICLYILIYSINPKPKVLPHGAGRLFDQRGAALQFRRGRLGNSGIPTRG